MSTLKYKTPFGVEEVKVVVQEKPFDFALVCYDDEIGYWAPFAYPLVDIPGYLREGTKALVKNYSENEGMEDFILENKLG